MANEEDKSKDNDGEVSEVSEVKDISDKTSVLPSDTFKLRLAQAGQAPPAMVLLVGPAASVGRQWPIEEHDVIMGRSPNANIFVDDRSVSKFHAKLVLSGGDVSIVDLESTNKTFVNGEMLSPLQPMRLRNNDQIKTGNIIFKFLERGSIETVASAQTFDRALTDSLTEIANRGALEAKAPEFFKRASLIGFPLSLLIFDIDKFKNVNDTYGHPAGDYILKEVSRVVKTKLIRGNDFFARAGGEEFCLLLAGSALGQAEEVAERIRATIEAQEFIFEGTKIPITISIGVASYDASDSSWKDIYERADKALYHSKNNGRNCVSVAS